MIGKVKSYNIDKNEDGDKKVLLLECTVTDDKDIRTVQLYKQSGEDTNPPVESEIIITRLTDTWYIGIATDDGIEPEMLPGEKKIYSSEGGIIKASIKLKKDGTIEINEGTDYAVKFNALKAAFDQLVSDFNSHVHPGVTSGGASTGTIVPPSTADMSDAKVDEVRL